MIGVIGGLLLKQKRQVRAGAAHSMVQATSLQGTFWPQVQDSHTLSQTTEGLLFTGQFQGNSHPIDGGTLTCSRWAHLGIPEMPCGNCPSQALLDKASSLIVSVPSLPYPESPGPHPFSVKQVHHSGRQDCGVCWG